MQHKKQKKSKNQLKNIIKTKGGKINKKTKKFAKGKFKGTTGNKTGRIGNEIYYMNKSINLRRSQ